MSVLPLHAVPPLLRFIVARNGNLETDEHGGCVSNLKQLRLVCKYFNEVVTSAAKGYCLQLSDHPSSFDNVEEHWRVAELLRYAKLDRLRVFIVVGPGKEAQLQSSHDRDIHACTERELSRRCFHKTHELHSHMEQLNHIISRMGPAMRSVTALELIIQFVQRDSKNCTYMVDDRTSDFMFNTLAPETQHDILETLAGALPHVTHLGVMEGFPGHFKDLFFYFKKISSIEQLTARAPNGPRELGGWYWAADAPEKDLVDVRQCNILTPHHLSKHIWESLPCGLTTLVCHSFQTFPVGELHWSLRSLHLTRKPSPIWKHYNRFCILDLCNQLADSPYLHSFSTALTRKNMFYGAMCLPAKLEGMQTLHTRICEGGLVLGNARGGVPVTCKSGRKDREQCFSLSRLLCLLPSFPEFLAVKLSLDHDELPDGCLMHLVRVFPCMETLILNGNWKIPELRWLFDCPSLRSLELRWNSYITMIELAQIALNMPWLTGLVLNGSG